MNDFLKFQSEPVLSHQLYKYTYGEPSDRTRADTAQAIALSSHYVQGSHSDAPCAPVRSLGYFRCDFYI